MDTVRSLKTIISLQLERLKQLEQTEAIRRLRNCLNKAGSRNLPNLPPGCRDIDSTVELSQEEHRHWLLVFENIVVRAISFTALDIRLPDARQHRNPQQLWETFLNPLAQFVTANRLGEMSIEQPDGLLAGDIGFGYMTSGEHMETQFIAKEQLTEEQDEVCLNFTFLETGRAEIYVPCKACGSLGFDDFQGSWKEAAYYIFRYLHHVATSLSTNPAVIHTLIALREKRKKANVTFATRLQ
jgi:hypothetical protein